MSTSNSHHTNEQRVLTAIDDRGVATVTLNNPSKHNTFDDQVIAELTTTFDQLATNKAIRVVILAAVGKSFCAGAEVNWMKRMATFSHEQNLQDAKALAHMLYRLNTLPQPTIARVQGAAFGGGVGLVSCCDIVIATEHASFSLSEVKLGMVPATISPYIIAAIGSRAARRYFITGECFNSATATQIGLVSECVHEDQLDLSINTLIDSLLCNGSHAITTAKQLINKVEHRTIDETLINETSALIAKVRSSAEAQEGLAAFLEKRRPHWIKSE
jgi:methylglutaconyl-CoA hydratase